MMTPSSSLPSIRSMTAAISKWCLRTQNQQRRPPSIWRVKALPRTHTSLLRVLQKHQKDRPLVVSLVGLRAHRRRIPSQFVVNRSPLPFARSLFLCNWAVRLCHCRSGNRHPRGRDKTRRRQHQASPMRGAIKKTGHMRCWRSLAQSYLTRTFPDHTGPYRMRECVCPYRQRGVHLAHPAMNLSPATVSFMDRRLPVHHHDNATCNRTRPPPTSYASLPQTAHHDCWELARP